MSAACTFGDTIAGWSAVAFLAFFFVMAVLALGFLVAAIGLGFIKAWKDLKNDR